MGKVLKYKKENKYILISLIMLFVLAVSYFSVATNFSVSADNVLFNKNITVSGVGEVFIVPDVAIVNVGVETINLNLAEAEQENAKTINKLIQILKENNVIEEDIKTNYFSVHKQYDYSQGQKLIGYNVSNNIKFKTNDLDNISELVSILINNGANVFGGINFTVNSTEEYYLEAISLALNNAHKKFLTLVNNENVVFEISEITENDNNYYTNYSDNFVAAKTFSENTSIMKGNMKITANVKVKYSYN